MKDKSEVEVVDLVLKLREKLVRSSLPCPAATHLPRDVLASDYHCPSRYGHRTISSL
jgi:hypothetical protein